MSSNDLPIIDFKKTSQNPGAVADELFQACTKWGTLNLTRVPQVSY
jgi:isopenicillin N synthase-like dioxygenase